MAGRKRKKKFRWTKQRILLAAEMLAAMAIFAAAVFSLQSTGSLEDVLGLPPKEETPPATAAAPLRVHYLDVDQGDCALIQIPGETGTCNVLVDAGDNGTEDELLAELALLGVKKLDTVVFTHPHADHIGGGAEVLAAMPCENVIFPPVPDSMTPTSSTYEALLDTMAAKGLLYTEAEAGMVLYESETTRLTVLSPQRTDTWDNLNSWSVVLRLEYGDTAFLFTGDAETDCERRLLQSGQPLACDVLKVGHHGSDTATSSAFLSACHPQHAVISCGAGNSYGHPHSSVLQLLEWLGVSVHRTDLSGTITAESDGHTVTVLP